MRIVFLGASRFGRLCLERVLRLDGCEVVGVVTAPEVFSISYRPQGVRNVLHDDIPGFCEAEGIEYAVIERGMGDPGLFERVRAWSPDAFLVVGWYHMVPKRWRELAPAYGMHASLLPDYSGGAPLVWAIINGETKTGITLFQLSDGVDDGPIVGQAAEPIFHDDTIATLYERIQARGIELLERYLPKIAAGTASFVLQDETKRRTFPQRGPEDGLIDWSWEAGRLYDFIRAQTRPYPGAFTFCRGREVKIWASRLAPPDLSLTLGVGEVRQAGGGIFVGCGAGTALEILEVSSEGSDWTAAAWWSITATPGSGSLMFSSKP